MCSSALCWTCNTFFPLFFPFFFYKKHSSLEVFPADLGSVSIRFCSRIATQQLTSDQLGSARLGSARLWRFLSASSRPATWQNSTLQSCEFLFSTCEQQFEGRTQKKVGIFVPVGFVLRMDGICSGPALSPLLLLRACCCVYRPLSWDLQPHEGLFTFIIRITWFRFLNFFSPSSHWDDWHFIHLFILLRHCFLSSSNTHMCELYPLVIMLTCYQLMLWLSCEMMWQSLMHFDCVRRERAGGT